MSKKVSQFIFESPEEGACDLLIIAGEHSGDEQASRMLKKAYELNPDLKVCAIGGKSLAAAGAQLLFDMTKFSVVGLVEVLKNYSTFKALSLAIIAWIKKYKPKNICFVDYPGFNLHLAKELKKEGISLKGGGDTKILYYVSPQIWAWKAGRRFKMAEVLDELAVIFPFEPKCYADTSLKTIFVGHPFASESHVSKIYYAPNAPLIFLPGSRKIAVSKIFPTMLETLRLLKNETAVVPFPSRQIEQILKDILAKFPDLKNRVLLRKIGGERIAAKAALMSSGTVSLSVCLQGIPGAIVYKANLFTYFLARMLVAVKYLGIANIILDRPAWPEFIQFDAKPEVIAKRLKDCISNEAVIAQAQADAKLLKDSLIVQGNTLSAGEWLVGALK